MWKKTGGKSKHRVYSYFPLVLAPPCLGSFFIWEDWGDNNWSACILQNWGVDPGQTVKQLSSYGRCLWVPRSGGKLTLDLNFCLTKHTQDGSTLGFKQWLKSISITFEKEQILKPKVGSIIRDEQAVHRSCRNQKVPSQGSQVGEPLYILLLWSQFLLLPGCYFEQNLLCQQVIQNSTSRNCTVRGKDLKKIKEVSPQIF